MPAIENLEKLHYALAFLLPGFIASYIYSQFIGGQRRTPLNEILQYLALTAFYFGITLPFARWEAASAIAAGAALPAFAFFLIGPAALGIVLGLLAQKSVPQWLFGKIGIGIVHPIPTAWDWRFSDFKEGTFVLVTMVDGSKVAGMLDRAAFASSDGSERDLYIDNVWNFDGSNWSERPERQGILIFRSEIRYIEFWNPEREVGRGGR